MPERPEFPRVNPYRALVSRRNVRENLRLLAVHVVFQCAYFLSRRYVAVGNVQCGQEPEVLGHGIIVVHQDRCCWVSAG